MSVGLVQVGIIDPATEAVPLMVDAQAPVFTMPPVRVTLTRAFQETPPPGWPMPPGRTGAPASAIIENWWNAGTTHVLFANVAAALIAANAATLA